MYTNVLAKRNSQIVTYESLNLTSSRLFRALGRSINGACKFKPCQFLRLFYRVISYKVYKFPQEIQEIILHRCNFYLHRNTQVMKKCNFQLSCEILKLDIMGHGKASSDLFDEQTLLIFLAQSMNRNADEMIKYIFKPILVTIFISYFIKFKTLITSVFQKYMYWKLFIKLFCVSHNLHF